MSKKLRDRVVELRRVAAHKLREFPLNPSIHTDEQIAAVTATMNRFGIVGALLGFDDVDEKGESVTYVFDGHLRRSIAGRRVVPVLILDLTFGEAKELIGSFDFTTGLKEYDREKIAELFRSIDSTKIDEGFRRLLDRQATDLDLYGSFDVPDFSSLLDESEEGDGEPEPIEGEEQSVEIKHAFQVVVVCESEQHQRDVFEKLTAEGHLCRVLTL